MEVGLLTDLLKILHKDNQILAKRLEILETRLEILERVEHRVEILEGRWNHVAHSSSSSE